MAETDELMTATELAELLRIPLTTLYQWRYKNEGPRAIKVGKHLRFRRTDVDTWLEENADPVSAAS